MPQSYWAIYLLVALRYVLFSVPAFLIYYWLKRKQWSFKKIQPHFPAGKDYLREIGFSIVTVFIFAAIGYLVFLTPLRQYTQVYNEIDTYGWWYLSFSTLLIFIVHDTYFYWMHRWMHHPAIYRWVHRVHHRSVNPSPWAALAFHPIEAVFEASIIALVAFLFPVHPLAIALFLLGMMAYNVYGHLGFELYPRGFAKTRLGKWVNTSVNHNNHHQFVHGNYGLYFLWWDRWMGTLRPDYEANFEAVKLREEQG